MRLCSLPCVCTSLAYHATSLGMPSGNAYLGSEEMLSRCVYFVQTFGQLE